MEGVKAWMNSTEPTIPPLTEWEIQSIIGELDGLARWLGIDLDSYNAIKRTHISEPCTRAKFKEVEGELLNGMWQFDTRQKELRRSKR